MRRLVTDIGLWALFAIPVAYAWPGHNAYPFWLLLIGLAGLGAAVAVSRRYPLASLFITVSLTAIDGNFSFALPVISYLVGRRMASIRPAAIGFAAIVVLVSPYVLLRGGFLTWASLAGVLVYAGLFPWLIGRYRRQQLDLVAAGWEHAEQLEREQRILADQVRLRERTRIAEDMHDSLGHELSLIALRAGALEIAPDLDERHQAAAASLRASAGAATERLREIIGVLRDDTSPAPTRPVDEDVTELVRRAKDSGMAVDLATTPPSSPIPPMVDRAVHRLVQEALTNANKYAPGAAVTVDIHHTDTDVTVTVRNAPPPAGPLPSTFRTAGSLPGTFRGTGSARAPDDAAPGPAAGGGQGLAGLRERVRLTGGAFDTGPTSDGGFRVTARMPYAGGTVTPAPVETASADRRRLAQLRARRGLVTAVAVPAGIGAVLGAVAVGYYVYATTSAVLSPRDYAALTTGQDLAAVERVLPRREMLDPPTRDEPAGATCQYYRSHGEILNAQLDVYQLCFRDGHLLSKQIIPLGL
ncbi:sensor histidine kinase [Micromonospora sp. CPCC 206061]|uniref:sensor histidine kinase n=1 Tax=Micromonospora sp. CPCC 206061 TaxID=3122410 RepID=UPI002FF039A2